ncbi:rho guanine nucleotide exchange factor 5-like isoform X2 [Sycon ciliatum]|uniref:rho guanine nucleotide exchange factor 5-like isoform X2 n=1 Tax=Sycon ciliatum TaxID=27933 RepID=UPI0031F6EBE0
MLATMDGSKSKSLSDLDKISVNHIRMMPRPSGTANLEGRNLLRQRNALQRVGAGASPPPASDRSTTRVASLSPDSPAESPMMLRSTKRRSFKASIFRMIGSNTRSTKTVSADDLDAPIDTLSPSSSTNSSLPRVKSLPAVSALAATDGQATAEGTDDKASDKDKKTLKKSKKSRDKSKDKEKADKKSEKKTKEKEKSGKDENKSPRKDSLPLWAQSSRVSTSSSKSGTASTPGSVSVSVFSPPEEGSKSTMLVQGSSSTSDSNPSTPVSASGSSATGSINGFAKPADAKAQQTPATLNRMKEAPMGLGLGEASAAPGKPPKKPKPAAPKTLGKPPISEKPRPKISRSKSASHTANKKIDTSPRPMITRQNGHAYSSTDSEPSREATPSPDLFSETLTAQVSVTSANPSACVSSSSGTSVFASAGEATSAGEVGSGGREKVSPCAGRDNESGPGPMLYQTWQFVSTSSEQDDTSEGDTPTSPVRPPTARKPAEEQLHRMHSSMRVSARRHDKKKMRWEEQPKVRNSQYIPEMTKEEQQLQQRYFEVVSSERSYNQSMKVLVSHFMESEALSPGPTPVIDPACRHSLFSNAKALLDVSDRFLAELEERLQESVVITTVCDIIKQHVECYFEPYVHYCSNQAYQIKTLESLLKNNAAARKAITELERSKEAQKLPLVSFLLLPMQRVTRLKLLVDAILKLVPIGSGLFALAQETLTAVKECVNRCNEGAKAMKRTEELIELNNQVDFGKLKPLAMVKSSRWLQRSGCINLINKDKKNKTSEVHLIALNDLLLIAKGGRKRPMYKIIDYCYAPFLAVDEQATVAELAPPPGNMLRSSSDSALFKLSVNSSTDSGPPENRCFKVTLLENSSRQAKDYMLEAHSITEKTRWLEALSPNKEEDGDERIYEAWDCPEGMAIHPYMAQQPDELSMEPGDIISVLKKMKDGWYQGQSQRTGEQGWFPAAYMKERETAHSRARDLRQQHLMTKKQGSSSTTGQPQCSPLHSPTIATEHD